jgi:ABC-type microcin C transport system duplicated ATPase subunit YejF
VKDLSVAFPPATTVKTVSTAFPSTSSAGETVALVGESGSGKSV